MCFYQTQDGYKFKSLDKLITQEPKDKFYYTTVTDGNAHVGSVFGEDKIIMAYVTNRNQNMLEKLRLGLIVPIVHILIHLHLE